MISVSASAMSKGSLAHEGLKREEDHRQHEDAGQRERARAYTDPWRTVSSRNEPDVDRADDERDRRGAAPGVIMVIISRLIPTSE